LSNLENLLFRACNISSHNFILEPSVLVIELRVFSHSLSIDKVLFASLTVNLGSFALGHHILLNSNSKSSITFLAVYGASQYSNTHSTASSSFHLASLVQYVVSDTFSKSFAISVYGVSTAFLFLA
jgi:hypothetical protein